MDNTLTTTSNPKITIEMCAYNRAHFLPFAIQSVLDQTFSEWELLILDDASTDNTQAVVSTYLQDPRIRYIRHEQNLGLSKNRNYGLRIARGEFFAILDSDDMWSDPTKLEQQYTYMQNNPACGVLGTYSNVIDATGTIHKNIRLATTDVMIKRLELLSHQFVHSSVLLRTNVAQQLGGYNNDLAPVEDFDLILNIGKTHELRNLPVYTTYYRIHSGNISTGTDKKKRVVMAKLHLAVIKMHKKDYPYYHIALCLAYFRIFVRSVLS